MRALVVVGIVLAAGAAGAQDGKSAAINAIAEITAAAPYCGFDPDRDQLEKYLAERGISRSRHADAEDLERAFYLASSRWRVTGSVHGKGKTEFDAPCQQAVSAYGPNGTIRPSLIKQK